MHEDRARAAPLSDEEWSRAVADLRDPDRTLEAVELVDRTADASRVPALYDLLADDDWYVRESICEPLARLEGLRALGPLLRAIERGLRDGHDCDGLVAFTYELLEREPDAGAAALRGLLDDADPVVRTGARELLDELTG